MQGKGDDWAFALASAWLTWEGSPLQLSSSSAWWFAGWELLSYSAAYCGLSEQMDYIPVREREGERDQQQLTWFLWQGLLIDS